ncbi:hypothetical protein CH63R_00724 [Colletotrichum higginsianum IMI 349063]|uniref:Uncharacterized protein n=1 Tax=Colletotrichum higginsianum (strain IMI 349063) TaxID=759273 RepID=A0A1B7YUC9_COLHI|nr:hypothetical protein CH63R_00724 [Colletotrichum higginsianum IMI 349063]OBR15544.1 hypothetical protein CH63R_00724 [Colletotrichum higginsianum IMI 349063]
MEDSYGGTKNKTRKNHGPDAHSPARLETDGLHQCPRKGATRSTLPLEVGLMVANQAAAGRHRGDLQEVRLQGVSHAGATGSQGIATRSPVRLAGVGFAGLGGRWAGDNERLSMKDESPPLLVELLPASLLLLPPNGRSLSVWRGASREQEEVVPLAPDHKTALRKPPLDRSATGQTTNILHPPLKSRLLSILPEEKTPIHSLSASQTRPRNICGSSLIIIIIIIITIINVVVVVVVASLALSSQ